MGLAETINAVGPAFFQGSESINTSVGAFANPCFPDLETICDIAIQILEQKAVCQQDPDQDDEDVAPEYQAEYDSVLISSAGDLVASIANTLGADFEPAFRKFFPLIAKYYVSCFTLRVLHIF